MAFAGCGGVGGSLEIADTSSQSTATGNVVVSVLVENTGDSEDSATLQSQVDVQGGDTYTDRRDISVPGGGSNSYDFEFDIAIDESLEASEYEYSASFV
ncbi:hypothetical protein BRD17_09435 [Halobacteriales archaeon SW_7_68_16]|nr:MAG: hypothetical protein BRD17_09435 [Halobacteriales archaeon SW_7_68_16]